MKVRVRRFKREDIDDFKRINRENWKRHLSRVYSRRLSIKALRDVQPDKPIPKKQERLFLKYGLVATCDGKVCGAIRYALYKKKGVIELLHVDHKMHGRGVGQKLMKAAEKKIKRKKISLQASRLPRTVEFYKKQGYKVVRKIKPRRGTKRDYYLLMVKER